MDETVFTPELGLIFETEDGESWTVKRRDVNGVFWASHNQEFSCYELQAAPDRIARIRGKHHNVAYLVEKNAEYLRAAKAEGMPIGRA